ncbi:MAG: hypothetical protein JEY99_04980 [Spirochaetales bacterium]|nr:hypothetical protein [Spirochaetales bacterium]
MNNITGIVVSLLFVFLIIGISTLLSGKGLLKEEGSRKFVHIGVGNWWFIAMIFFDNVWFAISIPALFIILNYISYRSSLFKSMERADHAGGPGTVYYAVSLFLLSAWSFSGSHSPWTGGVGILVMTYGDGFAAVIGRRYARRTFKFFGQTKSLEGSLTMLALSFIITLVVFRLTLSVEWSLIFPAALVLAVIATLIEAISAFGLDNLTVPLSVSALFLLISNFLVGV